MLSSMYSIKSKGTVASKRCVKYQDARMRWNSSRRTMSQRNWRVMHQNSSARRPSTGRFRRSGLQSRQCERTMHMSQLDACYATLPG